ncbi:MAG: outer membrane lipoprotein-sorting protein [Bacteroidales bacterium]|nr:outer membrane lipoprotein-sorting protein [Bacteroidales bacterium]
MNRIIIGLLIIIGFLSRIDAQNPTGREVMENFKKNDETQTSTASIKMSIYNSKGNKRERQVVLWSKTTNNKRKQLIKFESPTDVAGTGFLSIENYNRADDNLLYLPALGKTRRISGSDKSDNFVGTEFTYKDLESEDLNDYTYELKGSEIIDGIDCWLVTAIPNSTEAVNESGYSKREMSVTKDHYVIIQIKYFDKNQSIIKQFNGSAIKQISGTTKWRSFQLTMENFSKKNKTTLEYSDLKINLPIDDSFFTTRQLEK